MAQMYPTEFCRGSARDPPRRTPSCCEWNPLRSESRKSSQVDRPDEKKTKCYVFLWNRNHFNYIYIYIWVNYNISLYNLNSSAIWGWFHLLTMTPVRSQWGRYNLPRYMYHSYIYIYIYDYICRLYPNWLSPWDYIMQYPWVTPNISIIYPDYIPVLSEFMWQTLAAINAQLPWLGMVEIHPQKWRVFPSHKTCCLCVVTF